MVKELELSVDKTKDQMLDAEISLGEIIWANTQKQNVKFRETRSRLKQLLAEKQNEEEERVLKKEVEKQPSMKRLCEPYYTSRKRSRPLRFDQLSEKEND